MLKIGVIALLQRDDAVSWAMIAIRRFTEENVEVFLEEGLAELAPPDLRSKCESCAIRDFEKYSDMVITFGGDGTLLHAAYHLIGSDTPIMGVNVGKLGFLAEFSVTNLEESIMYLLKGNYRIVDRSTLQITLRNKTHYALNEILLERASEAKMIAVRASVNDHHVADYRADGVIVATPTGSTAYSLSSGGPIITPSADVLCITPISPHTLTIRPLVIRDDSDIKLELTGENSTAQIVTDGRIVGQIDQGDIVTIKKGEYIVKLVKRADSTYYDMLREKLLWSADPVRF
ncbi:MAG: NAD(+)/NADH kinase [Ignavibacteria bacterium]|nr:NAD(+)/NADH kinase [Ignavibacteria bacterium]